MQHCAKAVGYKTQAWELNELINRDRGIRPYESSSVLKGYTAYIDNNMLNSAHYGIIWSKSMTTIITIEGNTPDFSNSHVVNRVVYYWSYKDQKYLRNDGATAMYPMYVQKYIRNP